MAAEWKPPENASEVDRLNQLIRFYESQNLDQIKKLDTAEVTHKANAKRILELEHTKKSLLKTIKSLEGQLKFDKIASDGIKKKFNIAEFDLKELRAFKAQAIQDRTDHVARIKMLEAELNSNRSDKLRFMHESATLKHQNAKLVAQATGADKDAHSAQENLLERLQTLDNALTLTETQKRTIDAQSEELLQLNREMHDLSEKLVHSNKQVIDLEVMCSEYNRTIDILQNEVSRVRKELMTASTNYNVRSSGLLTNSGGQTRANRVSTAITTGTYGGGEDNPYSAKRRPQTQQGLARERNRLSSSGGLGSRVSTTSSSHINTSSHDEMMFLEMSGGMTRVSTASSNASMDTTYSRSYNSNNNNNRGVSLPSMPTPHAHQHQQQQQQQQYRYVDLAGKVAEGQLKVGANALPMGETPDSMRKSLLKDCDDKMVAGPLGAASSTEKLSLPQNAAAQPQHHHHHASSSSSSAIVAAPASQASQHLVVSVGNGDLTRAGTAVAIISSQQQQEYEQFQQFQQFQQQQQQQQQQQRPRTTASRSNHSRNIKSTPTTSGSSISSSVSSRATPYRQKSLQVEEYDPEHSVLYDTLKAANDKEKRPNTGVNYNNNNDSTGTGFSVSQSLNEVTRTYGGSVNQQQPSLKKCVSMPSAASVGGGAGTGTGSTSSTTSTNRAKQLTLDANRDRQQRLRTAPAATTSTASGAGLNGSGEEGEEEDNEFQQTVMRSTSGLTVRFNTANDAAGGVTANAGVQTEVVVGASGGGGGSSDGNPSNSSNINTNSNANINDRVGTAGSSSSRDSSSSHGPRARRSPQPSSKPSSKQKSLFVSSGLGLKHNQALDAELHNLNKGSTHQILQKILGDRDF